jgi:hypothetical protein
MTDNIIKINIEILQNPSYARCFFTLSISLMSGTYNQEKNSLYDFLECTVWVII